MAVIFGQGGSFTYNTVVFPVIEWSITINNDTIDVTSTDSNSWKEFIAGVSGADITLKGWWGKSAAVPPTTLAPGASAAFIGTVGGSAHTFGGNMIIKSLAITNAAVNGIEFTASGNANGAVTYTP